MVPIGCVREQLVSLILLVFMASSSIALPIVTEFSQHNSAVEKNAVEKDRNFKLPSYSDIYRQLIIDLNKEFNLVDTTPAEGSTLAEGSKLAEGSAINIDEVEQDVVLELSKMVVENIRSIKRFINNSSQNNSFSPTLEPSENDATALNEPGVKYSGYYANNYSQVNSNLNLELSGALGNFTEKNPTSAAKEGGAAPKKSGLELFKHILLSLLSPVPISLTIVILLISLLSRRS